MLTEFKVTTFQKKLINTYYKDFVWSWIVSKMEYLLPQRFSKINHNRFLVIVSFYSAISFLYVPILMPSSKPRNGTSLFILSTCLSLISFEPYSQTLYSIPSAQSPLSFGEISLSSNNVLVFLKLLAKREISLCYQQFYLLYILLYKFLKSNRQHITL